MIRDLEIHCVRCGRDAVRGQLHPELHRVIYLCDVLCVLCTEELYEWWTSPAGATRRSNPRPTQTLDYLPIDRRRRRRQTVQGF